MGPSLDAWDPCSADREELASAGSLSQTIERALDRSDALVVVAFSRRRSLRAGSTKRSRISAAGIRSVRARVRRRRRARARSACRSRRCNRFPPSLALADVDAPHGALGEPIAADARPTGDGFSAPLLKLAAGLLGIGYDSCAGAKRAAAAALGGRRIRGRCCCR
jgi:hypothetical protein